MTYKKQYMMDSLSAIGCNIWGNIWKHKVLALGYIQIWDLAPES